ncbi:MAG: YmdB family metallophosphoesterase [Spirochaetaceae bacterium]|nr:YmdB family metallophosphoesterase [Spirochaetaceae bacterium]
MRTLYISELVGKAGVYCLKKTLGVLKKETRCDFVIVSANGASGGKGLGKQHAAYIKKMGVDVITTGPFCFYKKDLTQEMQSFPFVLRPENLQKDSLGRGRFIVSKEAGVLAVAVLLGQYNFDKMHSESPYYALEAVLEKLRAKTKNIVIEFYAEATAEKKTLFALADGRCSAVIGSYSRALTADAGVSAAGTAFITDSGRTGSQLSVGGDDAETKIREYISGIPEFTKESWLDLETQGVILDFDEDGRSRSITPFRKKVTRCLAETER